MPGSSSSLCRLPTGASSCARRTERAPHELLGTRLERDSSKTGRVLERRRSERVDSLIDDIEMDQDAGRKMGARTGLFVPMLLRDRAIGVISAHDKEGADARFTDEDVRLAEAFAARAAVAVDLSERVATRCPAPCRQRAGARAQAARQGAARRDRPGADLDPARAEGRGGRGRPGRSRQGDRRAARARRDDAPGRARASPSSSARRRSTTSGSCRRSSGSSRPSASRRGSRSTSSRGSARSACPPRSRRRSTGSRRRR